jgi:UDP-N-acetylmuramate dehydrogenase
MVQWATADGTVKLSAAWLIEACGFKGLREGDAGMSNRHALVLVNHGHASGAELWALAQRVREGVQAHFGVRLEPEPLVV